MKNKIEFGIIFTSIVICFVMASGCIGDEQEQTRNVDIYSLGDAVSTSGRFHLGSGSMGAEPVYLYYEKTDRGSYILSWSDAYNSEIFMDENDHPYVIITEKKIEGISYHVKTRDGDYVSTEWLFSHAEFHVPENTIIENYNLDSE